MTPSMSARRTACTNAHTYSNSPGSHLALGAVFAFYLIYLRYSCSARRISSLRLQRSAAIRAANFRASTSGMYTVACVSADPEEGPNENARK